MRLLKDEWTMLLALFATICLLLTVAGCSSKTSSSIGGYTSGLNSSILKSDQQTGTWNQLPHGGIDEKSSTSPGCADK